MNRIKDRLLGSLGFFGYILFYGITMVFSFAPLFVLPFPFLVNLILFFVMSFFAVTGTIINIALWIWALVVTINSPQDVFSIIYYVLFAVNAIRIVICFLPTRQKNSG